MAMAKSSRLRSSTAKWKLREELTCPTCLGIFDDPRALPCQHAYCRSCLERMLLRGQGQSVDCPECRKVWQVPGGSADNLPAAFRINRLKEIHLDMEAPPGDGCSDSLGKREEEEEEEEGGRGTLISCSRHQYRAIDLYCQSCQKLICTDCIVVNREHTDHDYGFIKDVLPEQKCYMLRCLEPLEPLKEGIAAALSSVAAAKTNMTQHHEHLERDISQRFDEVLALVEKHRSTLLSQLKAVAEKKLSTLEEQEKTLSVAEGDLQTVLDSVHTASRDLSGVEFMMRKEQLLEEVESVAEKAKCLPLEPVMKCSTQVYLPEVSAVSEALQKEARVITLADPEKCFVIGQRLASVETAQPAFFQVDIPEQLVHPDWGRQKVSAELENLKDGTTTAVNIDDSPDSSCTYKASYTPQCRGQHHLHVKVNGMAVRGSPFSVFVQHPPGRLSSPVSSVDINRPAGITVSPAGTMLVADSQHYSIVELQSSASWSKSPRPCVSVPGEPRGVATDKDGNIFVTDTLSHQVYKFNPEGEQLKVIGGRWRDQGGVELPIGIAVDSSRRKVYVCDGGTHRVLVYSTELKLLTSIGSKGYRDGRFNLPTDVAFDEDGNVYVADCRNQRVQVFDTEGKHSYSITLGSRCQPHSIFVKGHLVYLTDSFAQCVHILTLSGSLLFSLGRDYLSKPEGVVVDSDDYVYVCDAKQDKVLVF